MVVDLEMIDIKPRRLVGAGAALRGFVEQRTRLSPLAGYWDVEVGPINRIVQAWPYRDLDERARVCAAAGSMPAAVTDAMVARKIYTLQEAPFSPALVPRDLGPVYEFRIYTYAPKSVPLLIERWGAALPERVKLSPLVGCWYADGEDAATWIHVWAYRDAAQRQSIRDQAFRLGIWPPDSRDRELLRQENFIALPASFSPLQ